MSARTLFEITGEGFKADGTDDHLVLWVIADTREQVEAAVVDTGGRVCNDELPYDFVYGGDGIIDFVLPAQAAQLTTKLLEFASEERNKLRGIK